MIHPPAVCEKAHRLERLLRRVEGGEPLDQVCADLGLTIRATDLPKLQARYEAGGRTWEALVNGRYGHPQKAHSALREWMYERKREDEKLTARELAEAVDERFQVELSVGHVNYLLRKVELTRPPGRPLRQELEAAMAPAPPTPSDESLANAELRANAGLFFPRRGQAGPGGNGGDRSVPGRRGGARSGRPAGDAPAGDPE